MIHQHLAHTINSQYSVSGLSDGFELFVHGLPFVSAHPPWLRNALHKGIRYGEYVLENQDTFSVLYGMAFHRSLAKDLCQAVFLLCRLESLAL